MSASSELVFPLQAPQSERVLNCTLPDGGMLSYVPFSYAWVSVAADAFLSAYSSELIFQLQAPQSGKASPYLSWFSPQAIGVVSFDPTINKLHLHEHVLC